jgi:8-oxo-dGTP diphosphatase
MVTIDKVAWIHIVDHRILSTRSHGRTSYYLLPGGKREDRETDLETLAREIREELTVELDIDTAYFVGEFQAQADSHPDGVQVRMRCYQCSFRGDLRPAAEIAEMVWLDYDGRIQSSPVDRKVFDWLRNSRML